MKGAGQTDSLFLRGDVRNYRDSIVFRWNVTGGLDYILLSESEIEIQKKVSGKYERIGLMKPLDAESWGESIPRHEIEELQANAALFTLKKLANEKNTDLFGTLRNQESINMLWANLSLQADLSPHLAKKLNLRYTHLPSNTGEEMKYRLFVRTDRALSDTLYYNLGGEINQKNPLHGFSAVGKESKVALNWVAEPKYSAYFVLKSGIDNWKPVTLNESALLVPADANKTMYYSDSVRNYRKADYSIMAIDLFGDTSYSRQISRSWGVDQTPPEPPFDMKITERKDKTLKIQWKVSDPVGDEAGFKLGVKYDRNDLYRLLSDTIYPYSQRELIVPMDTTASDFYFRLNLYDTAGNYSFGQAYHLREDHSAPAKPQGLTASVDSNGIVHLRWQHNSESDLDGYLIYFGNSLSQEISGIVNKPIRTNYYYDTLSLGLLNRKVYYTIEAVDRNFNRSGTCAPVAVLRPDTIRPVRPQIASYQSGDGVIRLKWNASSSFDVASHVVHRVDLSDRKSKKITADPGIDFLDSDVVPGKNYAYTIRATDSSGNRSDPSNEVVVGLPKLHYRAAVKVLMVEFDSVRGNVVLNWEYPDRDIDRITIYRGTKRDILSELPSTSNHIFGTTIDQNVVRGMTYFYAIKLYFTDGTETRMSPTVFIRTTD